jgi:hypothetical protein
MIRGLYLTLLVGLCVLLRPLSADAGPLGNCPLDSVGVDTSKAFEGGELILGMAWGESFTASDTLIHSVTVSSTMDQPSLS